MTTAHTRVVTDEELLRLPRDGRKYEIVNGEIIAMTPARPEHEKLIAIILGRMAAHVYARKLGDVYSSNALYHIAGANRDRSPDGSFISAAKLPLEYVPGSTLIVATVPDLVIEVPSPSDTDTAIAAKTAEYLMSGVQAVRALSTFVRQPASAFTVAARRG